MKTSDDKKRCPYLKEVVMIFCDAYALKKMVPLDSITGTSHCFGEGFHSCSFFEEIAARMRPLPPCKRPPRKATATVGTASHDGERG